MSEDKRLRLITNNGPTKPKRGVRVKPHKCGPCSKRLRYEYSALVQGLLAPHEADGKLIGGQYWWLCAKCNRPYYFIADIGGGNEQDNNNPPDRSA